MKKLALAALVLLPTLAFADSMDMKTAIQSAINNPPGNTYSSTISTGGMGFSQLSGQSGSNDPFIFEITKIMDYPTDAGAPHCGKLRLVIKQPNGFGKKDFSIKQYMSICSDGSPYAHPDMTVPKD